MTSSALVAAALKALERFWDVSEANIEHDDLNHGVVFQNIILKPSSFDGARPTLICQSRTTFNGVRRLTSSEVAMHTFVCVRVCVRACVRVCVCACVRVDICAFFPFSLLLPQVSDLRLLYRAAQSLK